MSGGITMSMQLKLDADGHAVIQDNKPVYVHDDGKEVPFDVPDMYVRLLRDGKRNAELQKEIDVSAERLKTFEGLDPDAARTAIEMSKNIEAGKLLSAGKVEEIKLAARKAAEEQVAAANKASADKIAMVEKERD